MVNALKRAGTPVRFTVYPDAGHDAWTETFGNAEIYDWMLKQSRQQAALESVAVRWKKA